MENMNVLDEIQREVKAFGGDVKALNESMQRDLAIVRQVAEAAKAAAEHPEVKSQLDALKTSVAEKHSAIEGLVNGTVSRLDDLEKKQNRSRIAGGWGDDGDVAEAKAARAFARDAKIARGELKVDADFEFDAKAVADYCGSYPLYLRRDLAGVDVKAMTVGSDPDGGYFVTPAVGATINGIVYETSPMRMIANIETISTSEIEFPRDDDEASGGWVGEQEDRTETSTPRVGVQRIPVHELYALPKFTQKLLEDSAFDVEGWMGRKIGDKFGRLEATAFVSGNGQKRPRGFVTYASGTFVAGGTGKIEQVAAATGGTVAWDDLIRLMGALKEYYLNGAVWLMQRATVTSLMLLKDGDGLYLWQPNQQVGKPSVLLGAEVHQAADMDAVGAGKLPIAFGNFKMGYTIVDRLGVSTLRDPYTSKPFIVVYTRKRVGGDVVNFESIKLLAT